MKLLLEFDTGGHKPELVYPALAALLREQFKAPMAKIGGRLKSIYWDRGWMSEGIDVSDDGR